VQESLLPSCPEDGRLIAVGWTKPASVTGATPTTSGKISDGRLGIFLGDALGSWPRAGVVVSRPHSRRALSEDRL